MWFSNFVHELKFQFRDTVWSLFNLSEIDADVNFPIISRSVPFGTIGIREKGQSSVRYPSCVLGVDLGLGRRILTDLRISDAIHNPTTMFTVNALVFSDLKFELLDPRSLWTHFAPLSVAPLSDRGWSQISFFSHYGC